MQHLGFQVEFVASNSVSLFNTFPWMRLVFEEGEA
jgi:hypothetical protein